jgi:hypothetical protein
MQRNVPHFEFILPLKHSPEVMQMRSDAAIVVVEVKQDGYRPLVMCGMGRESGVQGVCEILLDLGKWYMVWFGPGMWGLEKTGVGEVHFV